MSKINLKVKGMHCKACALGLEENLEKINFVESANVNYETGDAQIEISADKYDMEKLAQVVKETGFSLED